MPDVVIHLIAMGERDARAAVETFRGRTRRLVALSSGDVYQSYGRLTGMESGPAESGLLTESSPLRTAWYPYRQRAQSAVDWTYDYEKILMEGIVLGEPSLQPVVVRLPKVYGREENADLGTVYGFRHQPNWRWTHGYVENIAHAIVLAATHPAARGVYNVGEAHTPSVEERLKQLPPPAILTAPTATAAFHFEHHIAYDTSRIRQELGYVEPVDYQEGLRRTLDVGLW